MTADTIMTIVFSSMISVLLAAIAFFLKRNWDEHLENNKTIMQAIKDLHDRGDIQDSALSKIIGDPFDSQAIASKKLQMPKLRTPIYD